MTQQQQHPLHLSKPGRSVFIIFHHRGGGVALNRNIRRTLVAQPAAALPQRATTGLRRTTAELTDGSEINSSADNDNDPAGESSTSTQPANQVTMEISSSPSFKHLEGDNGSCRNQDVDTFQYPEATGGAVQQEDRNRDGDLCDYLVFAKGENRGGEFSDRQETEDGAVDEERGDGEPGETEGEVDLKGDVVSEMFFITGGSAEPLTNTSERSAEVLGTAPQHVRVGDVSEHLQATLADVDLVSLADDQWATSVTDDVSEQLQATLADVDLVSLTEDHWAAPAPGDVSEQQETDHEEARGIWGRSEVEGEAESEREGEDEEDGGEEGTRWCDLLSRPTSVSSAAASSDADRKLPADFRVQQEMCSDNVSTERVDFLLARQQWKKMEEEVKGCPTPKPGLKAQGSFQGTHTALYPPTRSPRLKHREICPPVSREPALYSTLSPGSEDSGLDDCSYRCPLEDKETAVEREIRLTLEREEQYHRERGMVEKGLSTHRPLQTGRSPPRPPACRTPTLSVSPSPSSSSSSSSALQHAVYHEMTANNVIILEPDSAGPRADRSRLLPSTAGSLSDWALGLDRVPSANVVVVETSNLIIRSASEFSLSPSSPVMMEIQESTFVSNPFFKLRSLSSQSLVEREIKMVRQREEEWKRQKEETWRRRREDECRRGKETYDTVLVSSGLTDIHYSVTKVPDRCVSSPSSPSRMSKVEHSSLPCDQKFPPSVSSAPTRPNAMAQRWEACLLANQKEE